MKSIWSQNVEFEKRTMLDKNIKTQVAIIGSGLSGLLCAYLLQENGINPVIIEAKRICSGQTKNTTAKITSQHGLIYTEITKNFGIDFAIQYANANENAIEKYRQIIAEKNIDCDFEEECAYLYSKSDINSLQDEYICAENAGIDCYIDKKIHLPFKTEGALVFNNQAQFNPLKFARSISRGLTIYENTHAIQIIGNTIFTPKAEIKAEKIIVTTHYPFINFPSMYFMKMSQERSYAIAVKTNKKFPDGMFIGIEKDSLSIRKYKDYLIIGDNAHRTGKSPDYDCFKELSLRIKTIFPDSKEIERWSAQDCITVDGIPYIGKFSNKNNDIFIATGFNKWGMSTSMVSAQILSDMIYGNNTDKYKIFSPDRFNLKASKSEIITNTIETVKGFAGHFKRADSELNHIKANTAGIIRYNGHTAGAYKNEYGVTYIVSLTCPHLKCRLKWNQSTKSWDCPCHGSRYNYHGELIDNPSQQSSILIAKIKQ